MKRSLFIILIVFVILGFIVGVYVYNKLDDISPEQIAFEHIEDECTEIAELIQIGKLDLKEVSSSKEKISPNSTIIMKTMHSKCNHETQKSQKVSDSLINLDEREFKEKYKDWEVQKFTNKEIVVYQEIHDFCQEHYLLKDSEGYIGIYVLDEKDEINYLLRVTDIATKYLTPVDLEELKQGIKVYTDVELNRILEDFE